MLTTDALSALSTYARSAPTLEKERVLQAIQLLAAAALQGIETLGSCGTLESREEPQAIANLLGQVTTCPRTADMWAHAQFLSTRREPVLIQGESGTGKESLARSLHVGPPDKFVAVNCGAIPDGLVESILFGHRKGAFTGAVSDHEGAFVRAHEGTLFLDEVGDLPASAQTKLLRALQEETVTPVGSNKNIPFRARLVCATHKSLHDGFRQDLYYRVAVHKLQTVPLRDRPSDIPLIARTYISLPMDPGLLTHWRGHDWPGNIRELRNAAIRAEVSALRRGSELVQACDSDVRPSSHVALEALLARIV